MAILDDHMKALVRDHTLGFLASVDADGTPNLSPKGTFAVLDDEHIGFGEMRSPTTLANIARQPVVELNFVDVFRRKGFRFKGPAEFVANNDVRFQNLLESFANWQNLHDMFGGIVSVRVERALEITSPAYDRGADEADLVARFKDHFNSLYP